MRTLLVALTLCLAGIAVATPAASADCIATVVGHEIACYDDDRHYYCTLDGTWCLRHVDFSLFYCILFNPPCL